MNSKRVSNLLNLEEDLKSFVLQDPKTGQEYQIYSFFEENEEAKQIE